MDTAKRPKSSSKPKPSAVRPVATKPRAATPRTRTPARRVAALLPPTAEDIARRAYEIYLARGGEAGDPAQDWLQAERELIAPVTPKPRKRHSAGA